MQTDFYVGTRMLFDKIRQCQIMIPTITIIAATAPKRASCRSAFCFVVELITPPRLEPFMIQTRYFWVRTTFYDVIRE
jgi:hypothetical protein